MLCANCGFVNGEDDHRCLHCGRIIPGIVVAAPASYNGLISPLLPFERALRQAADRLGPIESPTEVRPPGRVAPPLRRLTSGVVDLMMVLLGFGTFLGAAWVADSGFGHGRVLWVTFSASLLLLSMFYGLIWALARRETAGMQWTDLQLVTFDGSPVEDRNRAIRLASAWLSYCSGGLGLLWALADEESLTFHDHISRTYPAVRKPK